MSLKATKSYKGNPVDLRSSNSIIIHKEFSRKGVCITIVSCLGVNETRTLSLLIHHTNELTCKRRNAGVAALSRMADTVAVTSLFTASKEAPPASQFVIRISVRDAQS